VLISIFITVMRVPNMCFPYILCTTDALGDVLSRLISFLIYCVCVCMCAADAMSDAGS
jgi:hypothetical protein